MGHGAGLGQHVVGKDARQLVLADHHFHVDAKIIVSPEDFDDAPDGRTRGRGPTGDLDVNNEAVDTRWAFQTFRFWTGGRFGPQYAMWSGGRGGGRDLRAGRDDDGLGHALVEGNDDVLPVTASRICEVKSADDGGVAALQNAHNAALHTAVGFGRIDIDQDLIALHGAADLIGRDENIFNFRCPLTAGTSGSAIGPHEAVAVAVQIEATGQQIVARI